MKFTKIAVMDGQTATAVTPEIWAGVKTAITQKLQQADISCKWVTGADGQDRLIKLRFINTIRVNRNTQRQGHYLGYEDFSRAYDIINGVLNDFNISCNALCSDGCNARKGTQCFNGQTYEAKRPNEAVNKWIPLAPIVATATQPQTDAGQVAVTVKKDKKAKAVTK
jgi:hypothetical protein